MKKPIRVSITFTKPILIRAIKELLGNDESFILSETSLSSISCEDIEPIDVILCETEFLKRLENEHVCLAPKTLGISVWNNMISISKGDLQCYEDLDEIIDFIKKIANQPKAVVTCDLCTTETKTRKRNNV